MKLASAFHAVAAFSTVLAYYFQVDAPGTDIDKYWVRAHTGIADTKQGTEYAVFDFVDDQSLAWPDFRTILGFTFGPANQPLGFNWFLITTNAGAADIQINDNLEVDTSLPFYACKDTFANPPEIGDKYGWYASVDLSKFTTTDYMFSSSSETSSETSSSISEESSSDSISETSLDSTSETSSEDTSESASDVEPLTSSDEITPTDIDTSTDEETLTTETSSEELPAAPVTSEFMQPTTSEEAPEITPEITPAPSFSFDPPDLRKRDESSSDTDEVTLPMPSPIPYPVNFSTCIAIKLKAVTTSSGDSSLCTGTACCRTLCYYSCNTSTTGCPAPSCSTVCPNSDPNSDSKTPDPNNDSVWPDPNVTPTPVPPCSTCTPVPCTKCKEPNAWEVPGCPTCVRTMTNFVYTCPSLTTITVRTCPTVNKCGTKVITAPPGELTISGLAVIDAKEAYTTVLLQTATTGAGTPRTTSASGSGTTSSAAAGFSGGSRLLGDMLVAVLAFFSFFL